MSKLEQAHRELKEAIDLNGLGRSRLLAEAIERMIDVKIAADRSKALLSSRRET